MPSTVLPRIRSYVLGVGFIPVALTNSLSAAGAMRMDKVPGFQNSYFFAKTLIFCAFPQKNSYPSVGAFRLRPPQINQKMHPIGDIFYKIA